MSTIPLSTDNIINPSELNGFRLFGVWLLQGWQLFRRAPLRLFGCMVLLYIVEALVQWFVPVVGIPVSKFIAGILASILWLVLVHLNDCDQLQISRAVRSVGRRWAAVAGLAFVSMLVYSMQVAIAFQMVGPAAIDLLVFADPSATPSNTAPLLSPLQLALIFSSGIPLATLLMFAAPLILIHQLTLLQSLRSSVELVIEHATAMTLLALMTIALVFLVPFTFMLSVLITSPWLICVGFAAFRTMQTVIKQPTSNNAANYEAN